MSNFRSSMEFYGAHCARLLQQKAVIHVHSVPHFVLEIVLAAAACALYVYLHREVTRMGRLDSYKSGRFAFARKRSRLVCSSKDSLCTSVTRVRHQMSSTTRLRVRKCCNGDALVFASTRKWDCKLLRSLLDPAEDYDRFISMTPGQYVRLQKERRSHRKDLETCLKSLTTLYSNVVEDKESQGTLVKQLNQAREELVFPRANKQFIGFDTAALTNSLFDLLENIVAESSVDRPLPFKGDLTTLALDAGNLSVLAAPRRDSDSFSSENTTRTGDSLREGFKLTI